MLSCFIYLIVYCLIAVILVYVIETLLSVWAALPSAVFTLTRLLAALLVLLAILSCVGFLPWVGTPPPALRR